MGALALRIAPKASVFRDDADFDGPGAMGGLCLERGEGQKISPLISPLSFKNFFGHENSNRGSCGAVKHQVFAAVSSRCFLEGQIDVLFSTVFVVLMFFGDFRGDGKIVVFWTLFWSRE